MTTATLELPKGFTFEKLESFAKLLDLQILEFNTFDDELDAETLKHIDEGLEDIKMGRFISSDEVHRQALEICTK